MEDWEGWLRRPTASAGTIRGVQMPSASSAAGVADTSQDALARDRIAAGKHPTATWRTRLARRRRRLRHRLRSGAKYPDDD
eukprot:5224516-Lingulodinium_polyedra.AAC.1